MLLIEKSLISRCVSLWGVRQLQDEMPVVTKEMVKYSASWACIQQDVLPRQGMLESVAYFLSRDGAVEQLPNMFTARCWHGVVQVRHIYVFGGSKL